MDTQLPYISIILPVYNCYTAFEKGIGALRDVLDDLDEHSEIIVVNDGSEIDFDKINEKAVLYNCRLIQYKQNRGKGYAVKQGVEAALGKYIIYMDGDFPFDLKVIGAAYETITKPGVDMIIGDRTLAGSTYTEAPLIRSAGSKVLSFIVSRFVTPRYYDTQCGIKGFKHEVANDIFSKLTITGFSFDVEVIFIALKRKYRIEKIPVKVEKQLSSNVKVIFHGFGMLLNFFKIGMKNYSNKYR